MKRWLLGALALAAAATAQASSVDVVKIMNFSCPVCRASESLDSSIRDAVQATGGRFVPAPIPSDETSGARERVYYAAREQSDAVEKAVRTSLFKGSQDMSLPLSDVAQGVAWLQDDLQNSVQIDWNRLSQDASGPDSEGALRRAASLTLRSGAQALPTYIVLKNGVIVKALDPDSVNSKSLLNLRDAVVQAIQKASQ